MMLAYKIILGKELEGIFWDWALMLSIFLGLPVIVLSTLVLSICPHCHKFQSLNGRSMGLERNSLFIFKGISPFIHYCSRCGAPLSKKAVNEIYNKHNLQ